MKILNLYAGIGGNRKLWGNKHQISVANLKEQKDKEKMLGIFKAIQNGVDKIIDGNDE